jgi:hypothetical protein
LLAEEDGIMEPISAIVLSLALGAASVAGKEVVSALIKDAYAELKDLVISRYPNVSVNQLEQAPESKARRLVVEEDLTKSNASQDTELLTAAHKLTNLIQQQAPAVAQIIGVDLEDISAANLRLWNIISSGTGVRIKGGAIANDVEVHGVRAGVSETGDSYESVKKKKNMN